MSSDNEKSFDEEEQKPLVTETAIMDHIRKLLREQRQEIDTTHKTIQELEIALKEQKDACTAQIKHMQSKMQEEITEIRLLNRRQGFSIFQRSSRNTGGVDVDDKGEYAVLEDDVFSLMMINSVSSKPWFLGMLTFVLFQLGLGIAIIYDQLITTLIECNISGDRCTNLPFNMPRFVDVGYEVTFAQYLAVILVLATQTDILTSIQTILLLRNEDHVPWDKVIGQEGNRTWRMWIVRILLPNVLKFVQASVVLFASFIIIIQSERIIDLLKDFTAVLIVSQADNILFSIADMGYLGAVLAQKTAEAKKVCWKVVHVEGEGVDSTTTTSMTSRQRFKVRVFIFCALCSIMIGGLTYMAVVQYANGGGSKKRHPLYPQCNVDNPSKIGDGYCQDYPPYNMQQCGYDGGDCAVEIVNEYPGCFVHKPEGLGDGYCQDSPPYNTEECGLDGGDCIPKPVDEYPDCFVHYRQYISDGYCDNYPPYNTKECGYDGGDFVSEFVLEWDTQC